MLNLPDSFWENSPWDDEAHYWHEKNTEQYYLGAKMPFTWAFTADFLKHGADVLYAKATEAERHIVESNVLRVQEAKAKGESGSTSRVLEGEELELHYDTELIPIALMLYGFAFENLAKSIVVSRDPNIFDKDGRLKFKSKGHKLVPLVKDKCALSLSAEEEDMLTVLSEYATWKGRYHTPTSPPERRTSDGTSERAIRIGYAHRQANLELINGLYERLYELYVVERKKTRKDDK